MRVLRIVDGTRIISVFKKVIPISVLKKYDIRQRLSMVEFRIKQTASLMMFLKLTPLLL